MASRIGTNLAAIAAGLFHIPMANQSIGRRRPRQLNSVKVWSSLRDQAPIKPMKAKETAVATPSLDLKLP